jgi:hypothetical protein
MKMSKTDRSQQILNWLNSEKSKDQRELDSNKNKFISDIKKFSKEEFFKEPKKLSLWKKIKIMILGN